MKRSPMIRVMSIAACLALVMTACGRDDDTSGSNSDSSTDDSSGQTGGEQSLINIDDCTDYQPTAGIDGETITIGTVRPATGSFAIFDKLVVGLQAWVDYTNGQGGVKAGDGKSYMIDLLKEDDAYDSAKTPGLVEKLVEQDGVFAIVGEVGTANNLAVRDYINDNCVPSVSLATGSVNWGDAADFPWFQGGLPSYATEARRFVDWLKETKPDASIALLYQDDDFGQAYKDTIESEIKGTDITIADEATFNPLNETSTESKVAQLAGSNADVFFVGISGAPCPATLKFVPSTWTPMRYVSLTCASKTAMSLAGGADEGVYSAQATLDPATAADIENPRMKEFIDGAASVGMEEGDISGGIASAGWSFGAIFGAGLENADEVTRAGLMDSLYSLDGVTLGLFRDEVKATTNGADDPWLVEDLRMVQRTNGEWVEAAPFVSYEGESNAIAGR